ncbi:MAG: 50S ribosomal protein L5 [bacterium]|nr:50S ribosomal protein L5 [bacterium]
MSLILDLYKKEITKKLKEDFSYGNVMEIPKIETIVVNAGVGRGAKDAKELEDVIEGIKIITGQAPVKTKAKKSIAGFKLRDGMEIGAKVTIRGEKMYDFLDRLVSIALPRVRDFRGLKQGAFDGHGNYSIGVKDHAIFPEIPYDKFPHPFSLQINIKTSAKTDDEARALLTYMGFPFKK